MIGSNVGKLTEIKDNYYNKDNNTHKKLLTPTNASGSSSISISISISTSTSSSPSSSSASSPYHHLYHHIAGESLSACFAPSIYHQH